MNFTPDQLAEKGYTLNKDGSYSPRSTKIPNPVTQHPPQQTLVALPKGKETRSKRTRIIITRYSCRPLDCDNYAGGCKPIIDQLRYAKLIQDDDPETIEVDFRQIKVKTKNEEHTEIEINEIK